MDDMTSNPITIETVLSTETNPSSLNNCPICQFELSKTIVMRTKTLIMCHILMMYQLLTW